MFHLKIRFESSVFSLAFLLLFFAPGGIAQTSMELKNIETAKYQNNLGNYYWHSGNLHKAISAWNKALQIYQDQGKIIQSNETIFKIIDAYTNLGQLSLAIFQLQQLLENADPNQSSFIALVKEKLGNAHKLNGELDSAINAYHSSLELDTKLSTLNNLVMALTQKYFLLLLQGESSRDLNQTQQYLQEAESTKNQALSAVSLALTLAQSQEFSSSVRSLIELAKFSDFNLPQEKIEKGRIYLNHLTPSTQKIFLLIQWAKIDSSLAHSWLKQAELIASEIGNLGAKSSVLVDLAYLEFKLGNEDSALNYARSARLDAQPLFLFENLYRAQWLAAKVYLNRGESRVAIDYYHQAIDSLYSYHQTLFHINAETRIQFQTLIEPLYREMLTLLLEDDKPSQANLQSALSVFGKFRLAQLQNFFGDNCFTLSTSSSILKTLETQNAVALYSIILDEQTHFLLQLSDGTIKHHQVSIPKQQITQMATTWSGDLQQALNWKKDTLALDLYDLIIRPFERELNQTAPNTIIFIHDGVLRNIPMAALKDRHRDEFLVQKWATISSVGFNFSSRSHPKDQTVALAFGLGVSRHGWTQLNSVEAEIENVIDTLDGKKIKNRQFTYDNLDWYLSLSKYSVLHLATHAYFGGVAENSLILAYDRPLTALDLDALLSETSLPLDLLVLSACETAISSDFSALGLAGVALRNNVNSVLGSFWQVKDDEQLELIQAFYRHFAENQGSLAQALQLAQIERINSNAHVSTWAVLNFLSY